MNCPNGSIGSILFLKTAGSKIFKAGVLTLATLTVPGTFAADTPTNSIKEVSTTVRNQILVELRPGDTTPANLFDLNAKTLVFTPDGGGQYSREITALQWEEDIGMPVGDGDRISLENFDFDFAGQRWDAFFVNSHGVVTFGGPLREPWWGGEPLREIANRFITAPTISPLFWPVVRWNVVNVVKWAYNASLLNVAHWPDRVVVTWITTYSNYWVHDVPPERPARVQAVLRADGKIVFSYVDVSFDHGIVGVFPDSGTQPATIDLSQSDSRVLRTPGEVFHYPSRPDLGEISCRIIDALGDNFDLFVFHSASPFDGDGQSWCSVGEHAQGIGLRGPPSSHLPCGESRVKGQMCNVLWMQSHNVFDARRNRPFRGAKYIFTHEVAHTWGAFVSYDRDGQRQQLSEGPHWPRWLHTPAAFHPPGNPADFGFSVLGGFYWRDNGDGTYTSEFGRWGNLAFSWLDLYLMGLAAASEVPDLFILRNPKPVDGRRPTYRAEKETISIEQIIAAEGPRKPSAAQSQKDFNAGFVYLLEAGQAPSGSLLDLHARQRDEVVDHWALITGGRSRLTTSVGPRITKEFSHFANGAWNDQSTTSDLVLLNVAPSTVSPTVYFYNPMGELIDPSQVVDVTDDLETTADGGVTAAIVSSGELTIPTHGRGPLVTGSVKVISDGLIGGVLRFNDSVAGVAGVGAGRPVNDAVFPARRQVGGINTGAAIRNPETEPMTVTCRLMQGGEVLETAKIKLEGDGQKARFIHELFPDTDTSDFVGSVRCAAPPGKKFTGVALELDAASRIFTTLPLIPVGDVHQDTNLHFAHFAAGDAITSDLVLVNVGAAAVRPAIYFHDPQGRLVEAATVVDVTGDLIITDEGALTLGTGKIPPLGEWTVSTVGTGKLTVGSVKVVSDGPLGGVLRFDSPSGVAGVGASQPVAAAVFPARRQVGGINTGAAIRNLETEPMTVTCQLMKKGVVLERRELALKGNGQAARFVDEMFPRSDTSGFVGSVVCAAPEGGRFAGVALELDVVNRIFTTLPLVPVPR